MNEAFSDWLSAPRTVRQGLSPHLYDAFAAGWKAAKENGKKPVDMAVPRVPITIVEI
jgi:hypothetical protein